MKGIPHDVLSCMRCSRRLFAAFAIAALAALEALIHRQLVALARHTMRQALRGARIAATAKTADSMVAAAHR
jgi:hypothetical protein